MFFFPSGRQNFGGLFCFVCFWLFDVLYFLLLLFFFPCLIFLIALHQLFRAWSLYKSLMCNVTPLPWSQLIELKVNT